MYGAYCGNQMFMYSANARVWDNWWWKLSMGTVTPLISQLQIATVHRCHSVVGVMNEIMKSVTWISTIVDGDLHIIHDWWLTELDLQPDKIIQNHRFNEWDVEISLWCKIGRATLAGIVILCLVLEFNDWPKYDVILQSNSYRNSSVEEANP